MGLTNLKFFRNFVAAAFLVAGCGGAEPIPIDLAHASEPCEYGKEFMAEGMMMVMKDGHVTLAPKEVQAQGVYAGSLPLQDTTTATSAGCEGCH